MLQVHSVLLLISLVFQKHDVLSFFLPKLDLDDISPSQVTWREGHKRLTISLLTWRRHSSQTQLHGVEREPPVRT
jgi:hypothetical protein